MLSSLLDVERRQRRNLPCTLSYVSSTVVVVVKCVFCLGDLFHFLFLLVSRTRKRERENVAALDSKSFWSTKNPSVGLGILTFELMLFYFFSFSSFFLKLQFQLQTNSLVRRSIARRFFLGNVLLGLSRRHYP